MRMRFPASLFPAVAAALLLAAAAPAAEPPVGDFLLRTQTGRTRELYRLAPNLVVLIAQGNGCPIIRKSIPEIQALRERFRSRRVAFLMINANSQDSAADVAREAKDYGLDIPVLLDGSQTVARSLGLTRTAEAVVIDPKGWRIAYRGAIDDRYGYGAEKTAATRRYLADAIEAVLAGRPAPVERTEASGCAISYARMPDPAYARDVAPLLKMKCLNCHGAADGPAPLTSYEKARGWSAMIRETVMTGRMPPWSAESEAGKFLEDVSLSTAEQRTLVDWIDAGAPRGEGDDPLSEAVPSPRADWPLGPPDLVLAMKRPQSIPVSGALAYQYFELAGPLDRDLWITAADIRPGNARVIHHAFLMDFPKPVSPDDRKVFSDKMSAIRDPENRNLWDWHPGRVPNRLPGRVAIRVPKGHSLVLEIHYNASGKPETDLTRVGLYLHSGPLQPIELKQRRGERRDFTLPPGELVNLGPFPLAGFPDDACLVSLRPHMHYRGEGIAARALYPDGRKEALLVVHRYDFNWQYVYDFAEPKLLPAGTKISMSAVFDNTAFNPANPDPRRSVAYGLSSSDEMFFMSVNYFDAVSGSCSTD